MRKKFGSTALLTGTAVILTGLAPATGQDLPGSPVFTFGFDSSLRINDNLGLDNPSPGVSTLWDNRLSVGYLTETPGSRFSFDLGGTVRGSHLPGAPVSIAFDEPSAELSYAWEGANSRFEAEASYRQVDLSFADPLAFIDDDALIFDDGTRISTAAQVSFETGLNDPLGFGGSVGYTARDYTGTTDPALFDSSTLSAEVFTRLRFSPLAEGTLTASWENYDANNATQTSRVLLGLTAGVTYEFSPITTFTGSLGYKRIEETTNAPSTSLTTGLSGSAELTHSLPNGSVGVQFESDPTVNGQRNTLSVNRVLALPSGALSTSLGVTRGSTGTVAVIGSLDYQHELPQGAITASVDRRVSTNALGNDILSTGATLGYRTDITPLSAVSFDIDFAAVSELFPGPAAPTSLTSLRATYSYELTPDWDLSSGYEHRVRTEFGQPNTHSNEIFLVLEREFTIRP